MPEKLLLVEGKTDKYFIEQICIKTQTSIPLEIRAFKKELEEGIEALLRSLPGDLKTGLPEEIIGLVVDADMNQLGRWQRIRDLLTSVGYQVPEHLSSNGLIISSDLLPRFGLWIMPDNNEEGILENFIRKLIHSGDVLQAEVNAVLDQLKEKQLQLFTDRKRPKAFIKTWLAWQENPEMSFGVAIHKNLLDHNHELAIRFVTWLNTFFNPTTNNQ